MRCKPQIELVEWLAPTLPADGRFEYIMHLDGEVFRDVPGRKTLRVTLGGRSCFIKQHFGVGWAEIFKNLTSGKWPVLTARTEWDAIRKLGELGIATTPALGYGVRGCNPAALQSFLITQDLGDIVSLETLCADWKSKPPSAGFKRKLLMEVAELARKLHEGGMNHRDFYLCHICLDKPALLRGEMVLYLIDLHRVGIRPQIRPSDRMKDLAALYFSAMEAGLSKRDHLRFLRHYRQRPLRRLADEQDFWQRVARRAGKLYLKFHGKMPEITM